MWTNQSKTLWDIRKLFCQPAWNLVLEGAISVSMPKAMRIFKPLHTQQYNTQWDYFSSGPREVCQAQDPTYSILLKKPKCEANIYSIWQNSNTGRVYQKRILLLFTVLGLTVQCFWKCVIEQKYVKKKRKKAAGTVDVTAWVAFYFFFLIIIFILPKSPKSESGVFWTLSGGFPKITACQHPFYRNESVYLHHCIVKSSLPMSLTEMSNSPFPYYSGISLIVKV